MSVFLLLLLQIAEFSKGDFMRLITWIRDPEDHLLLHCMYTLEVRAAVVSIVFAVMHPFECLS